jgi:hypothetical protein
LFLSHLLSVTVVAAFFAIVASVGIDIYLLIFIAVLSATAVTQNDNCYLR